MTHHTFASYTLHYAPLIEELHAGCDPDFDPVLDDLEREFAELRMHIAA